MPLKRQEIFNTVYTGLRAQGFEPSIVMDDACAYRGQEGRKCAIGFLIPDDRYSEDLEGCNPWTLESAGYFSSKFGKIDADPEKKAEDVFFLNQLQSLHDSSVIYKDSMRNDFEDFAKKNNLTIPE